MSKLLSLYLSVLFILVFTSCEKKCVSRQICGLASPISLSEGENIIILKDYFLDISQIDSVSMDGYNTILSENNEELTIKKISKKVPKLSVLNVFIQNKTYQIVIKASQKILTKIYLSDKNHKYKKVQIKGEMNAWNPENTNLIFSSGIWSVKLFLDSGKYQYLIVVDGKEMLDPENPNKADNNIGGVNSVLSVGNSDQNKQPKIFTYSHLDDNVILGCENHIENTLVFWQNSLVQSKIENDIITFSIPKAANELNRSFIRVFGANEFGFANDLLIPLENGKVVTSVSQLNRSDKHTQIIYNIMIDRFYNGNKNNDKKVDDPSILPKANYFGGDITGIKQQVENNYFGKLGINTIWISPIVQNPEGAYGQYDEPKTKFSGYHGYWPISFTKIDYRFGTDQEFKNLVNLSHQQNMNVLLDFVANHVHENHPVYQAHKDWATNLYLPDGTLNTEKWDEHRLTTWFDVFLPTLDLSKPEVYNMLSDSALFWISEYNIDGFRHDATKHIPEVFWRTLTYKMKKKFPAEKHIYQVGETYGSRALIGSYVSSGKLDGQFDFNVYDASVAVFVKEKSSMKDLKQALQSSFDYYGYHNLMAYITGNQDRARFISYADGAVSFSEDAKKAGWNRKIEVSNNNSYKKSALLMAFNMVIPGIPVIYYGDEIGMSGGNDPDNRRMMVFEDDSLKPEQLELRKFTSELINLRKSNMALLYGDTKFLVSEDDYLILSRSYFNNCVIAVFNKSDKKKTIEFSLPERFDKKNLTANFNSDFTKNNKNITLILNPYSVEILINK